MPCKNAYPQPMIHGLVQGKLAEVPGRQWLVLKLERLFILALRKFEPSRCGTCSRGKDYSQKGIENISALTFLVGCQYLATNASMVKGTAGLWPCPLLPTESFGGLPAK